MAWFKQIERKSPAALPSQAPARPAPSPSGAPPSPEASFDRPVAPGVTAPGLLPHGEASSASSVSRVSRGLVLKGEITGREDLAIDGEVEGTLHLAGARVTVGPAGRVRAYIFAREIVVQGKLSGDLRADERIEIGRSGSLEGSAAAKRIAVEEGATIAGLVEVLRPGEVARSADSGGTSRAGISRATWPTAERSPVRVDEKKTEAVRRDEPVIARDPSTPESLN